MLRIFAFVAAAVFAAQTAAAAPLPPDQAQFAPYKFLIGVWNVVPEAGGAPVARLTFRWGPNESYVWYAQSLLMGGKEVPHFEGMLAFNGVRKNLDMLLTVDLQYGLSEESGSVSALPDGSVVREITAYYAQGTRPLGGSIVGPEGLAEHFRQTYHQVAPGKVLTTVMHETDAGWVPTFPGSDHLMMVRIDG